MRKIKFYKIITSILYLSLCVGFRYFPGGNQWSITAADPTIWVHFCSSIVVSDNDLPSGDPLYGTNPTFTQLIQSVYDDFNNLDSQFARLAPYPADANNPGAPSAGQSTFTLTKADVRTIEVCYENSAVASGHSTPKISGGRVVGCTVTIKQSMTSMKNFVSTLGHEIGHCLGLDHPQEQLSSLMSYYTPGIRLQVDDKMGLTHLYPAQSEYGNEEPTLGFACSPK